MNKFEKLIEYVINDEDGKAQDLFHKIVVEKSRDIYEGLLNDESIGGDQVDELLNDVEADEQGMREDDEEMAMDIEPEMDADFDASGDLDDHEVDHVEMDAEEGELEDRVVDLEDKLDELMAEFDSIVGSEDDEEMAMDIEPEMDVEVDAEIEPEMEESMQFESEEVTEEAEEDDDDEELEEALKNELEEAVALTKVSKGIAGKSEEAGINKKSMNNDNSGQKGSAANPVNFTSTENTNNKKVSYKEGDSTTEPRVSNVTKPKNSEEAGTDKKSVIEGAKRRGRPVGSKNKKTTTKRKV